MFGRSALFAWLLCVVISAVALAAQKTPAPLSAATAIADQFSTNRMRGDLKFLADDLLEGRGTGARGGDIAAAYIAAQFEIAGLKPLGDNGTFMQAVPMTGLNTQPESTLAFTPAGAQSISLKFLDDFVANALTLKEEETFHAPVVFAGYGINAPESGWNDFAGMDVKGKVVIVLVNDPPSQDPNVFGGKAMTYYGRWTYKYEEAARQQAAGVLIIHNTETAAYDWGVVRNSNSGEQAYLAPPAGAYLLPMAGWIQGDSARKLFSACGMDLDEWVKKAGTRGFKAVEMPMQVDAHLVAKVRPLHATNVVGILEGSDPKMKDEAVLYSAHYDHLGVGNPVNGDNIYNGAVDNASGVAFLIELARVFSASPVKSKRSVIFLSVTGEERGLRGSEYFGNHPPIPTKKMMLDLNFDGIYFFGRTSDIVASGAERTTIWPVVQEVTKSLNMTITPESHPEGGHYYRSDHFSLARVGVPAFSLDNGHKYVGKPDDFGEKIYLDYLRQHYHKPSDEYDPSWDFSGVNDLARLGIGIGWKVANTPGTTGWKAGDEFYAIRNQ